ncbi:hypothetical protein KPH14_002314 [Odynerus spinipes]|uniref:Uncharacterized protein n=1 Tax=Odynerus spinipes TaxID=1348599 RepID=A0AAD9RLA1_9HYME|nr:hypothetical protein KPH14_002314 [Odynerus spinipes]
MLRKNSACILQHPVPVLLTPMAADGSRWWCYDLTLNMSRLPSCRPPVSPKTMSTLNVKSSIIVQHLAGTTTMPMNDVSFFPGNDYILFPSFFVFVEIAEREEKFIGNKFTSKNVLCSVQVLTNREKRRKSETGTQELIVGRLIGQEQCSLRAVEISRWIRRYMLVEEVEYTAAEEEGDGCSTAQGDVACKWGNSRR